MGLLLYRPPPHELLDLGARKIAFFERNEFHSSPLPKHENRFYRVREGDLFWILSTEGHTDLPKGVFVNQLTLMKAMSAKITRKGNSINVKPGQIVPTFSWNRFVRFPSPHDAVFFGRWPA
jgi:hypothetical protein